MKIYDIENLIKKAGEDKMTLKMIYLKSSDGLDTREVEPYEIRGEDFFGYDVAKKGIRRFKMDQISSIEETVNSFEPRWEIKVG